MPQILNRKNKPDLAYNLYKPEEPNHGLPPVIFLGGFRSDMQGTKAIFLEKQCMERGQSYLRFDYRGHGQSGGVFEESVLSDWLTDVTDIIQNCFDIPVILVGSSMGGWLSLLYARDNPKQVQAVIGLAAAPDFTSWMRDGMNESHKSQMLETGSFLLENDYGDPYSISERLLDDGDVHLLLKSEIDLKCPVTLIQGKKDADVPWETAERAKKVIIRDDTKIIYLDEADHRLSAPDDLTVIGEALAAYL